MYTSEDDALQVSIGPVLGEEKKFPCVEAFQKRETSLIESAGYGKKRKKETKKEEKREIIRLFSDETENGEER